jgi:alpha-1,3-glucan synthase
MTCIQIAMFDIDGIRMDKALQTTIDAMVEFGEYQRSCAKKFGKSNFLFVGEVVGDPRLEAVFIGRGKQPTQALNETMKLPGNNVTTAVLALNDTDESDFIRPFGKSALDSVAFHYDIYGAMTRFLGYVISTKHKPQRLTFVKP